MKKHKTTGMKLFGVILAAAGAALIVQTTPLYIWYILLAMLSVTLALLIMRG